MEDFTQDGTFEAATDGFESDDITLDDIPGFFDDAEETTEAEPEDGDAAPGNGDENGQDGSGEGQTSPKAARQAEDETIAIKYNGQEMQLPKSELVSLAQKGMNYDKVVGQLQDAKNSRENQVLANYAKANGMEYGQYVAFLERSAEDVAVQKMVEEGMPEEKAREHHQMPLAMERQAQQVAAVQAESQQKSAFLPLVEKYPDVKTLPPEVAAEIESGVPPLAAYELHMARSRMAELESRLQAKSADEKNRKQAPGSAKGNAAETDEDAFLRGFNSN